MRVACISHVILVHSTCGITQTIPYEHLRKIGDLYTSYDVHDSYGLGILHRRFTLDQGYIMVHIVQDKHVDICRPQQLDSLRSGD